MYRRTSNMVGLSYPPSVISVLKVLTYVSLWKKSNGHEERTLFACRSSPPPSHTPTQNVDRWSFDVFALNEASGDHALKFIFYELLTRYDLISRFKVKA